VKTALSSMTGTPSEFADTPAHVTVTAPDTPAHAPVTGPDVLSEMLRAVRLTGSVFLNARFSAPFRVESPKRFDEATPTAHLRHVSVFHLIAHGRSTVEMATGERRDVVAGDLLLVPFADRHFFGNGEATHTAYAPDIVQPGPIEGMWTVDYGGGGEETRLVCGFLESSEFLFTPVFRTLPTLSVEHTADGTIGALIAATVREIIALVDRAEPGTQLMLGRLMELLFMEVLRRHVARLPAGSTGWLAALNDPIVGRALQLVHTSPARRWTAEDLAREAGSSRTVLAERFKLLLGRPPIDYVTGWRIQLAADRLRSGSDGIATIAADVGYESEAAFSRAFKRETGMTPGRWRDGESPPLAPASR
jgi:AraC family transcriptional regulator, alkane utilization regulator